MSLEMTPTWSRPQWQEIRGESPVSEIMALSQFGGALQRMAKNVGDIAYQTNLLALNAAIEAAGGPDSEHRCARRSSWPT